ncbi:MAG: Jag N-terminal domain-containing protein, partial [Thermomicrobiales bacterium]
MQQRTSVEIQAYSVDEAVRLALEQLALPEDAVDIEILSDAGPDEDAEALVRVTAKGHASQPTPSAKGATAHGGEHRDRGDRPRRRGRGGRGSGGGGTNLLGGRAPGDRPSQRGTPPRPVDRADAEDERVAKEVVADL